MVRATRRQSCIEMRRLGRQSHRVQRPSRGKSVRPRRTFAANTDSTEPGAVNPAERRLSINLNHRRQQPRRRGAALHQQQQQRPSQQLQQPQLSSHQMLPMTKSQGAAATSGKRPAISAEGARKPRVARGQLAPRASMAAISALLLALAIATVQLCNCDNANSVRGGARAFDQQTPAPLNQITGDGQQPQQQQPQHRRADVNQGERMLASLATTHLRLVSPSFRSLALARPSKFDSGSEKLRDEPAATIHTRSSPVQQQQQQQQVKTLDDIMSQHFGNGPRASTFSTAAAASSPPTSDISKSAPAARRPGGADKAERDLRQIMLLHEQAGGQQSTVKQAAAAVGPAAKGAKLIEKHLAAAGAKLSPLKLLAGREHANSNQTTTAFWPDAKSGKALAASVLSYFGPKTAAGPPQDGGGANSSANPFTPRMSAKTFLVGPLLGLGQMFALPPDAGYQKTANKYSMPVSGGGGGATTTSASESQATYVLSNAINQPQGYSSSLKGLIRGRAKPNGEAPAEQNADLAAEASSTAPIKTSPPNAGKLQAPSTAGVGGWIKNGANQLAHSYFQDSFRDLLTLTQLPILSAGPISTAPSELEPGGKKYMANRVSAAAALQQAGGNINTTQALDDFFRYAYILANLGVRRKRDPLKALGPSPGAPSALMLASTSNRSPLFSLRAPHAPNSNQHHQKPSSSQQALIRLPKLLNLNALLANRKIKPRGVMWDMATDPSLAVTVFHLLERASVALPLGFLLMPLVHMIRNPLNGINLGRIIPARASHRSVDYEELAKRIDMVDKILSRALRPTHRESASALSFIKR